MSNKPFSKKIHYLYEKLNYSKKEFTNLFWDGDKKKFASRHTTVHKSWLGKGIEQVKGFDFDAYEISNLKMGEETVFTEENFMYDGFEVFKERVDK
ncbi:MAG: hypothetical protein K0U38_01370, partial [Epsilonproteobacteria bacterium]|nr:hypothetical protein [Campylobacterota bacterium]